MAYIGIGPASFTNNLTNVQILDDISGDFDGNTPTFNLTANDVPFHAVSDRALMVILGGVIQAPGVDYTINLAQITFTTNPVSGLTFYARNIYGLNALNGVNDGIVGPYSLTTGGPSWDTSGNITISGNLTVQGATTTIQSTTLDVIDKDIKLASNQSTNAGIDTAGLLWGTTAVKLKYYNNGGTNPGLNIEGTNVGIGVTAPTAKLDVDGDVKFTGVTSGRNAFWDKSENSLELGDWTYLKFGADTDLTIWSNDTASAINNKTGELRIPSAGNVRILKRFDAGLGFAAELANFKVDGAVELFNAGNKKFETTGSGIDVTGTVVADDLIVTGTSVVADLKSTNNNNVLGIAGNNATVKTYLGTDSSGNFLLATGSGVSTRLGIDAADGHITPGAAGTQDLGSTSKEFRHIYHGDSGKAFFGLDQDLSVYHNNSHAFINNSTGNLNFQTSGNIWMENQGGTKVWIKAIADQQVELYYNNEKMFQTNSDGSEFFDSDSNLNIYFTTNDTTRRGYLFVESTNGGKISFYDSQNHPMLSCTKNSSVDLYHDNALRLQTSSTGISVTGEVAATQDYPTIKPSLDLNFAATKTLDPRIEYYRYGPASYIDANGKVVFVGADVPRFDHDPDTGECLGLLIEQERRNMFLHGLRPGDRWSLKNGTFEENTDDTKAPDGTYTATKWTFTDADPYVYQTTTMNSVPYTMSIWVKAGTNTAGDWLQMRMGSGAPYSTEANSRIPADGSWHRLEYTKTPSAGSQNIGFEPEGAGSSMPASGDVMYIWGAQLESGDHASSLIPTTGTSVTRGADYAAIKGDEFTEWYNDLEGTIFTSHSLNSGVGNGANNYVLEIGDAGSTHVAFRLQDVNSSYSNNPSWGSIYSGSATARFTGTGTFTRGNKVKSIMSGKSGDFAGTFNGEAVQTDTSGSFFGPGTTGVMSIGRYGPSTGYELEGHIQRITYWPKQLTDTQLKTLTS